MATANGAAPPQVQAQVNGIVGEDAAKNRVPVHQFNPDATPQEKGAAAGAHKDKLKSVKDDPGAGGKEVTVDTGNTMVVPTITIEDVDKKHHENGHAAHHEPQSQPEPVQEYIPADEAPVPGAMPAGPAPVIPDWYKVGWRAVGGIDNLPPQEGEEKDKSVLAMFLSEQFYGEWYHNAALIVVAVVTTHFLTRFGFGWGWLFIVLAFCNTHYSLSMSRVRRRARDDIQRELVKTRLDSDYESAEWINNFLDRFWLIYEPVLSQTVVASVDQILSTNCPAFLDSLRLSTFTLGTKAPRINKVKTSPRTADDVVLMEWSIAFTPTDESELTQSQIAAKVNPKIVLSVRLGKGLASAAMPILLENITFSGLLRVRMKLMTTFPHVQLVDLSFLEKPVIDYVLKPIGGETFGFDIASIPGLSSFIRDMVHGSLGPMMYDPNVFTLNLEQLLSGEPLDTAIGVMQVTIHSARGIKGQKIGGGTPDPFVSLSINQRTELARTKYKSDTNNPTWMETKFLLVNSLTESLVMSLLDYNEHRKDTELESAILKDGKERGTLRYDVSFYPVLKAEAGQGGIEEIPDTKVGIVRLTVHQAKDLDPSKSMSGDLNPFVKVHLGGTKKPVHTGARVKHTNNPVWETSTEFLCTDKTGSVVTVQVDPVVGYMSIRLEDLLNASKEAGRDWWPLSGCRSGKVRLGVEWKPLNMAGSLHGADQYVPPIGVVRLWLQKATDVKNVEATLGGKSDPYTRVQINNVTLGRTEVVNNNLNPQWDQIIYIPVHSLKETMMLECMDYQHLTKDRSLGYVELKVADLARPADPDPDADADSRFIYASTGKKAAADPLKLDKGFKGSLHYEAEFVPAIALKGVAFESHPNEIQRAAEATSDVEGDTLASDASSISSSNMRIPDGITASKPLSPTSPTFNIDSDTAGHKKSASTDTALTAGSVGTAVTDASSKEKRPEDLGVEMSKEQLLQHQSGVIIFNVLSGQLHKKARLEVLLDDAYWPAFSTVRARSTNAHWEYIGEGFVKELDFGRVWLRLNDADEGDKDEILAEWKGDAKPFLNQALSGPSTFTLIHSEDEDKKSIVEIEARFVPVPIKLEPRESINNQGTLRVDLLDGREIQGVDRGGKSDPFVVFQLNGQKIYKSQTKKKTLNPEWNENFIVQVPSRVAAEFSLEVFDWNQIEQAKSLGTATIELASLEPFQATERSIVLSSSKHGEKGAVRIIAKSRKNTSTFSSAGRAMTQIGHLPVGAGRGVIQGVTGVFKKDPAKRTGTVTHDRDDDQASLSSLSLPGGQASHPIVALGAGAAAESAAFPSLNGDGTTHVLSQEPGTLRVTIMEAKDLSTAESKPYVVLRVGDKEHKTKHAAKTATPEWNESFTFAAAPATQPKMFVWIYDHKTLGKDKLLASAEIDLWRHLQSGSTVSSAEVLAELREGGLLNMRLEFDAENNSLSRPRSSFQSAERSPLSSPSRFSITRRRDRDD
ncbi:tricalbin [Amylocystis lapponica]|nr:tricalbin [Amylocystis lapponica]